MLITTNPAINSLFIVSASLSEIVDVKISELSLLARQARYLRDYNRLAAIGSTLMNLSARSENVGRYFYSLAEYRYQAKEFNEKLFEELAQEGSLPLRAASTFALGVRSLECGKLDAARRLVQESYHLATWKDSAPITTIHSVTTLSQLLSMDGSHRESLEMLRTIHPSVRQWAPVFPCLLGEQFNNIAYELFKVGELEAAYAASNRACALPVAKAFPEWFETRIEIEEKRQEKPSPDCSFVPASYERAPAAKAPSAATASVVAQNRLPESARRTNILPFKRKCVEIWLKEKTYTHFLQKFPLVEEVVAESFLMFLLEGIDELRDGDSPSVVTIYTRLLENFDIRYETENFISRSNMDKLFQHLDTTRRILETGMHASAEDAGDDTAWVRQQTQKIFRMIEEDENRDTNCAGSPDSYLDPATP